MTAQEKVINLLENNIESVDFSYFLKGKNFETFEDVLDILDSNDALNVDIVYYSEAIKFLAENDPSLTESLELASDMGYETKNLNSELLASLLATEKLIQELWELEDEVNETLE